MDPLIRKALTWTMLGLAVVLLFFTGIDLAAGANETAMWLSMFGWAAIIGICWAILAKGEPASDPDN